MKKNSLSQVKLNNALLCDFYELTMMQGYFLNGFEKKISYFDIFFRKIPDSGSFAIFAGLEDILDFVSCLHFSEDDIVYLRSSGLFKEEFLTYLKNFKFNGEIYAMQEGEVIFPNEPLMIIKANAIEAQILESFLLLSINHQSLIATKANRIVRAAKNLAVLEFGTRRAHGSEAALKGARAAIIGGCVVSSCTLAGKNYNITTSGTMAHSWVQMFNDELSAFCHYLELYPKNPILLIDTYDYKQGLSNAIKAFKKFKVRQCGVRIDSGNLEALSKEIRVILDQNDLKECKIIASNSLDEKSIEKLLKNKAPIDAFGVGERLITASSDPVFGCVYKLVAIEEDGVITPKIKISEDKRKTTTPHFKKLFRIYDKKSQKILFDELYIYDEKLTKLDENLERKELLKCIFKKGKILSRQSDVKKIATYTKDQISKLDKKFLDFNNKEQYEIKLSKNLKNLQKKLIKN